MNTTNRRTWMTCALALLAAITSQPGCSSQAPPASTVSLNHHAPEGWELRGRDATVYRVDVDGNEARRGVPSATLLSTQASPQQFALLAQQVDATAYRASRVRFSGYLKTGDVQQRAFLWLRVDSKDAIGVSFDDMHLRSLEGTTRWQVYEVLLDVPADATVIRMGAGLIGTGQIWLSDCLLEIVDKKFASTNRQLAPISRSQDAEDLFWIGALDLPKSSNSPGR